MKRERVLAILIIWPMVGLPFLSPLDGPLKDFDRLPLLIVEMFDGKLGHLPC